MALSAGTRLGPYEILEPLGAGGMGEVYRARDTRLERTVAVKVLPAELAADPQLRARLEREARAISALAHPNICTLHDVGEEDGRTFLVMEHLVGQTLAERLEKGALPLEQALEIATQIADALSAAHKQGIVHRDLKPGNVMLTKTGARLLDFGLARLAGHGEQPAVSSLTSAPTQPAPLTGQGTVLGTLPYMAPEQVEGKPADARTDIWALGTVLYEMVAGQRAFQASSPVSLVGAILEREPTPLKDRQPLTPPPLERLVRRCLAKDPDDRWDTAHDLAVRLKEIAEAGKGEEAPQAEGHSRRWTNGAMVAVAAAALLAGGLTGRVWKWPATPGSGAGVVRSHIVLPSGMELKGAGGWGLRNTQIALSADGQTLVWSGSAIGSEDAPALYLHSMETGTSVRIPGTDGAEQPFFSPDGQWVGFFSEGSRRGAWMLRKVSPEEGLVVDLCEARPEGGASWATDGRIYADARAALDSEPRCLGWVPAQGGSVSPLTTVDLEREVAHRLPRLLPGGRTLLVTTLPQIDTVRARVEAFSTTDGARTLLVDDCADARYLPTGHLVCARRGVLMAASFDPSSPRLKSGLMPVVQGVSQALNVPSRSTGAAQYAVSDSGLLVYAAGGVFPDPPLEALLFDESGQAEPLPGFDRPLASAQFRFSPDGRQIAFVERSSSGRLWLFDIDRRTHRALSNEGVAGAPRWSPDGTRLVVLWSKGGPYHVWSLPIDGRGEWERLTKGYPSSWSPDGQVLAFVRQQDILLYGFADRRVTSFLAGPAREHCPEFSPDGRWLAYESDQSGQYEIYVTSYPDRGQTYVVSQQGGEDPAWSRDGRRLYYRSVDGRSLFSVSVTAGRGLLLGKPTVLFSTPSYLSQLPWRGYDLHPGGRFLFGRIEEEHLPPITRLNLVHNWFEELERLVPTD